MVECGSLENCFRVKPNGGSNPPLSVDLHLSFLQTAKSFETFAEQALRQPEIRQDLLSDVTNTFIEHTGSLNVRFIRHNWND